MRIQSFLKAILVVSIAFAGISACTDEITTTVDPPVATDYDISGILSRFDGTGLSYTVGESMVTFTTQNLPNHPSPYWPVGNALHEAYNGTNSLWNQNPNTIQTQEITITVPLYPAEAAVKQSTSLGPIGISLNGVVFYNQYAGPNNQPLTNEVNSFDQYLGHPQNFGQYHYHVAPTYLTTLYGNNAFLGLLADGFPVYGPTENGSIVTNADLDDYHGHTSETVDFPEGIYHYHITPNQDPYINGNGYFGTPGAISN